MLYDQQKIPKGHTSGSSPFFVGLMKAAKEDVASEVAATGGKKMVKLGAVHWDAPPP